MTTYTIATLENDLLLGICPDGGPIEQLAAEAFEEAEQPSFAYEIHRGITLTDDDVPESAIVYGFEQGGHLVDENGREWRYAVRRYVPRF